MPRTDRWQPNLSLFVLLLLLVSLLPAAPAEARRRTQVQLLDDKLAEFSQGTLQRTALAPIEADIDPAQGGVQLAPIAYIQQWGDTASTLKECVTSHGAVALNDRIYVIGGLAIPNSASCSGTSQITPHVWSNSIRADGNTAGEWIAQPDLIVPPGEPNPVSVPCTVTSQPRAGRSSLSVATFDTGETGFIYVLGGALESGLSNQTFSTSSVLIGRVDASGNVVSWQANSELCLPQPLERASAATVEIDGDTFIYVVGGLRRFFSGGQLRQTPLRTVYFARLDPGTGEIEKVSDGSPGWDVTNEVPIAAPGIWSAGLASYSDTGSPPGTGDRHSLFLAGGEKAVGSVEFNPNVFRGDINIATKQVAWSNQTLALTTARSGLTGIEFDGNLMYIGGRSGPDADDALREVLSNQIDDQLGLPVGESSSNFYKSEPVFRLARYNHASALVSSGANKYVYLLGGQGLDANSSTATNTIFFGRVASDAGANGYALSGWYTSPPRRLAVDDARVLSVSWNAQIDRSLVDMDAELEFRTTSDATLAESSWSGWQSLADPRATADGNHSSVNGFNAQLFGEDNSVAALYFQFRALLRTERPNGGAWQTPALLSVGIEIEVPGFPNLKVPAARALYVDEVLRGIEADISNQDPLPSTEPLQPVYDGKTAGSFTIDIWVYGPNETAVAPTLGQIGDAYGEVNKQQFPYTGNGPFNGMVSVRNWCEGSAQSCDVNQQYDITRQFTEVGLHTVYIMVDSTDNVSALPYAGVEEAENPGELGEADNLFQFTVNIEVPCPEQGCGLPPEITPPPPPPPPGTPTVYLPIVAKT